MKIVNVEQGSLEWHNAKLAKISGTRLQEVMGTGYARAKLIAKLLAEEGTEQVKLGKTTDEMARGLAEEDYGIKLFEEKFGKKVDKVGLCVHDDKDWLVLSPDGLIKDEHGKYSEAVEIKSPNSETAIYYQMLQKIDNKQLGITPAKAPFLGVPAEYKWQVVHYFIVNDDLKTLYFLVYDVRFIDDELKLNVVKVERENELLLEAIGQAKEALDEFRTDWQAYKELILPSNF